MTRCSSGPGRVWLSREDEYKKLLDRAKHKRVNGLTDLDKQLIASDRSQAWVCRDAGQDCEGKAFPCRRCGVVLCHYHHYLHRRYKECE